MSPRTFADCKVWVTGGQRGIGFAIAREFARVGAELVITSRDPHADSVRQSVHQLEQAAHVWADSHGAAPRSVRCLGWDMASEASTQALGRELKSSAPDILVHSAHVFGEHTPIVALKPDDFTRSLSVNVGAAYALCRLVGRHMARAGFGRILLLGSLASQIGGKGQVAYITEKAALEGLTRAFAVELAARGVLVNIIHPGIVDTENVRARVPAQVLAAYARSTVSGRLLHAEEVALTALSLCDPRTQGLTGQSVRIGAGVDSALALMAGVEPSSEGGEGTP